MLGREPECDEVRWRQFEGTEPFLLRGPAEAGVGPGIRAVRRPFAGQVNLSVMASLCPDQFTVRRRYLP
ncbi:hypothetical protein GCM10009525_18650 [Streptosporangium amethystogenes subsp. fukuiense]